MKKLFFLLIAAGVSASAIAQGLNYSNYSDNVLPRWAFDLNLLGGLATQTFTSANTIPNYTNGVNMNTGELKYKNGYSLGADAQLGFFFGKKRHFGLGAGIMFMEQHGTATLTGYSVEYQARDGAGNIYRQSVKGNDIKEDIKSSIVNIPLVLKYKNRFSKHWGFAADAGALINLQMNNDYTTHASFDQEAMYKFVKSSDGGTVSVYDNAPVPSTNDWMITKAEFLRNNPNGSWQDYSNAKRALGINVGDGLNSGSHSGSKSYTPGSVGFILQPSFNYYLSDNAALNFGVYYMMQPFKNSAQSGYRATDGNGSYNSGLNNVTASNNQAYGLNIGARFFLGRKQAPLSISFTDHSSPSQCGMCDGSITLQGLTPNKPVTVDYSLNSMQQGKYSTNVQPDGNVKIANLCSGNYTGIVARIHGKNAMGTPVTLAEPTVSMTSQNTSNPTTTGSHDGSVTFYGKYAGKAVAISYYLNGMNQKEFTGIGNSDNSITITGLGEGSYTGIAATVNNCSTKGSDFTLAAPAPPAPLPVTPAVVVEKIDISTPILFESNKANVNETFDPEMDMAADVLKEHKGSKIYIDGHADTTGSESFNKTLSLARANSVKAQLTKRGISANRLTTKGYGSKIAVATNKTVEGRQQNRRAIMTYVPPNKKPKQQVHIGEVGVK